jgi:hypothetical protein
VCEVNATGRASAVPAVIQFDALRDVLAKAGCVLALPELHGGISGVLCSGAESAAQRWLDECLAEYAEHRDPKRSNDLRRALLELVLLTQQMLASSDLTFEPLLPDEDSPLDEQVAALALWCHGFLSGLGFAAGEAANSPDGELAEVLADFAEISRAGLTADEREDRDQADFALAEIKEYVRVSVQIVFEELALKP